MGDVTARRYRALLRRVRLQSYVPTWSHCHAPTCAAVACLDFSGRCVCMCVVCSPPWGG